MNNASALIGNIAVVIVVLIAGARGIDWIVTWFGFNPGITPNLLCATLPMVNMLSSTVATALIMLGILFMGLSGLGAGGPLLFGGLVIMMLPAVMTHYIGANGCAVGLALGA